jgi:dTDP-glucose 4,6-dehydratase
MNRCRILVTGGAGFIGSSYVRMLLTRPDLRDISVTVLDSLTYAGDFASLAEVADDPRFAFVQGDICDPVIVSQLAARHDDIVNFAAESHVDRSIRESAPFVRTGALGVCCLLDAALHHGVRTFVQVSTDEVYGSTPTGSWSEDAPLRPSSPYAAAKAAGDLLALSYHRTHGLDVRITRCGNNYGPGQHPEKFIPLAITRLLDGLTVPLHGDGGNVRSWIHVNDHIRGIDLARRHGTGGEVYHIGAHNEISNRDLAERLVRACGATSDLIEYVPDRKVNDRRYSLNWTKVQEELGYQPCVDFTAGLIQTVGWYRTNRQWWQSRPARVPRPLLTG